MRVVPSFPQIAARQPDPESEANEGYKLLQALRDKVGGMLLLTATPMQLHEFELYSMIELVEPGLFRGYADFEASRPEIRELNEGITNLRTGNLDRRGQDAVKTLLERYGAPEALVEAATQGAADQEIAARWLSTCHRLSIALVRNRKAEIGGFKTRRAHRIQVTPTEDEIDLEHDVQEYIRARYAASRGKASAVGLVLVAFQKMLCSSSDALAAALDSRARRLKREEITENLIVADSAEDKDEQRDLFALESPAAQEEIQTLQSLARRASAITDSKLDALDELASSILSRDPSEKILIFSQYLGSIEMIRARLADRFNVRVFHGQMTREDKDLAHDAFRKHAQVLISSEAGGEGRNFQFCHIVVNYDLPWNPMKIEQRIGRVDRVGQTRDVEIYNFAVEGMLDGRILDVLEHRIRIFTETVGALDPILESLEDEITQIALGARGEADKAFSKLDGTLKQQLSKARQLEELRRDFVLDWRSLQRDEAARALGRVPRATRDDLERFCRLALGRYQQAGKIEPHPDGGLHVKVPGRVRALRAGTEEDYRGSFDVVEALRNETLHFFAMGHPLVEALIDSVGDPWWSPLSVLESDKWTSDRPALLVDYRLELFGLRNSGELISHLVTEDGVREAVDVLPPDDPWLEVRIPDWPKERVEQFRQMSTRAAREVAFMRFEQFKEEHAGIVEQELERLGRMFDSRRAFLDQRVTRQEREIARLEATGSASERRIVPALQGQVKEAKRSLAVLEKERAALVADVQKKAPEHFLRMLGATVIVRRGRLESLRTRP